MIVRIELKFMPRKLQHSEYYVGDGGLEPARWRKHCLKRNYNRNTKIDLIQKIKHLDEKKEIERARARPADREPKKKFKSLNGFKNKYTRKSRRANLDYVEKIRLIEFMFVGGYGSPRRGGLLPGGRRPRCLDDP